MRDITYREIIALVATPSVSRTPRPVCLPVKVSNIQEKPSNRFCCMSKLRDRRRPQGGNSNSMTSFQELFAGKIATGAQLANQIGLKSSRQRSPSEAVHEPPARDGDNSPRTSFSQPGKPPGPYYTPVVSQLPPPPPHVQVRVPPAIKYLIFWLLFLAHTFYLLYRGRVHRPTASTPCQLPWSMPS